MKMTFKNHSCLFFILLLLPILLSRFVAPFLDFRPLATSFVSAIYGGHWELLHESIGVSAMHMQVLKNNKVVIFDRTDMGPSNLTFLDEKMNGDCPITYTDESKRVIHDCTAHSLLYDVATNTYRPLIVHSNTWCSSGSVTPDGTLIQTGGYGDGIRGIRAFSPCDDDVCDWVQLNETLNYARWYASNQILPDGRVIVLGGRRVFTYEFVPAKKVIEFETTSDQAKFYMSFLKETRDRDEENNLYPFLHLLPDGNLFVFANKNSILFDYKNNRVLKEFPVIPGEDKRNYPSTGSSVLLPLTFNGNELPQAEVLICGGSPAGAYNKSNVERVFVSASRSCGRLKVTNPNARWVMEVMPMPRVMSDMLLLPTGDVLIINGASNGTAGWENAVNPVPNPLLYLPNEPDPDRRFVVLNPSTIPRMYHSSAVLLPDGRILVGGSNPHSVYNFTATYPTDLSLEVYHPHYLGPQYSSLRPSILTVETNENIVSYGQQFSITLMLALHRLRPQISVSLITPSFSTHSFAMNQRMVVLELVSLENLSPFTLKITASGPPTANVAPPGYYMLFIVHAGIPSEAVWVKIQ